MGTKYVVSSICDWCKEAHVRQGSVVEGRPVKISRTPLNWFRAPEEDKIFCCEDCLYAWVRERHGEEAEKELRNSVWTA